MNEIYRLIFETPATLYFLAVIVMMVYQMVACNLWKSNNTFIQLIGTMMIQLPALFTILLIIDGAK